MAIYKIVFQLTADAFIDPEFYIKRLIFKYKKTENDEFTKKIINFSELDEDTLDRIERLIGNYTNSSSMIIENIEALKVVYLNKNSILKTLPTNELSTSKKQDIDALVKTFRYI